MRDITFDQTRGIDPHFGKPFYTMLCGKPRVESEADTRIAAPEADQRLLDIIAIPQIIQHQ